MAQAPGTNMAVTAPWASDILDFWFGQVGEAGWWTPSAQIDAACTARFAAMWADKRTDPPDAFLARSDEALAAILLFDQLPRNMFRGTAQAFATDALARDIARGAVAQGYDIQIGGAGRMFFYMPFQHSEAIEDQDIAIRLFDALGNAPALDHARQHRDIIARHGRFPHRNEALGRTSSPDEMVDAGTGAKWLGE